MRTTHEPAHMTPVERRRRRLMWAAGGAAVAAVAGAGLAWALLSLRADINGGGEIAAAADIEFTAATAMATSTADCTATAGGGDLGLNISGTAGEFCDVSVTVRRIGEAGAPQVVNGLTFADAVTEGFLGGVCTAPGRVVPAAGTTMTARFTLDGSPGTFTALATAGLSTTDTPATAGGFVTGCPVAA